MMMNRNLSSKARFCNVRVFSCVTLLFLALILVSGCGGGTRGTGDIPRDTVIRGKVLSPDGAAEEGVSITVLETGESTRSNENGDFEVVTEATSSELSLLIERQDIQGTIALGRVEEESPGRVVIEVAVTVDVEGGQVLVEDITVTVEGSSEDVPTALPPQSSDEPSELPEESNEVETPDEIRRKVTFRGKVLDVDGAPFEGVRIALEGGDAQEITTDDGRFSFTTEWEKHRATLRIIAPGTDERVTINDLIPKSDLVVSVTIRVVVPSVIAPPGTAQASSEDGEVTVLRQEVRVRE